VVGVGFAFPITRDHGDVGDHGDSAGLVRFRTATFTSAHHWKAAWRHIMW